MNIPNILIAKKYRIIVLAFLTVILFFIVLTLLVNPILNHIVKPELLSKINSPAVKLQVDHLSYSIFSNKLTLNNIELTTNENDSFNIKIDAAELGINWFHLAFEEGYKFSAILIDTLRIYHLNKHSEVTKKDTEKTAVFSFLDSLSHDLGFIYANSFTVNNGFYKRKNVGSGLSDSLFDFNLNLEGVLIDNSASNEVKLKICKEIDLKIDKAAFFFEDNKYKLTFKDFILSSNENTFSLKNLALKPYLSDNTYFKTAQFRSDRFILEARSLNTEGLDIPMLLNKDIIKADQIVLNKFVLDALTNMRLPVNPDAPLPKMPNQIINDIPFKLNIERIKLRNGNIFVKEIYPYDETPGVLLFGSLFADINNLKNNKNVLFNINTKLTGTGNLNFKFNISLAPGRQIFSYQGRLDRMKAEDLNKFISVADRVKVTSGMIDRVDFSIQAKGDTAIAAVIPVYSDLSINELDEETGKSTGLIEKFNSFIANTFVIKKDNAFEDAETTAIHYVRQPDNAFLEYVWLALRAALGDIVGFE